MLGVRIESWEGQDVVVHQTWGGGSRLDAWSPGWDQGCTPAPPHLQGLGDTDPCE